MPKDSGAEQGDVDGFMECSWELETVAAETRMRIAEQQAARTLPWIGMHDPADEQRRRMHRIHNFQLGAEKHSSQQMNCDTLYKKRKLSRLLVT